MGGSQSSLIQGLIPQDELSLAFTREGGLAIGTRTKISPQNLHADPTKRSCRRLCELFEVNSRRFHDGLAKFIREPFENG